MTTHPSFARRQAGEILVGLCLVAAPFVLPHLGMSADLLTRILIWGLFGLGFDLLFGYTGLLSFGQSAFYGVGGFVSAYLLTSGIVPHMLLALLIGTVIAALAGLCIGYLTLRRTGIYFAMSTLAFGEMFYFLENSAFKSYTGGENGIAGVPPPVIELGFTTIHISSGWPMYWFVALFFFLGFVVARRIVRSPFGAVLKAIRGNPKRAMALGHAIQGYKLTVFVIAAAYGGLAGGLLGMFQSYMPPDAFSLDTSAQLVIQTVMGGAGTLLGPLLGATIWLYLYEGLQQLADIGAYWKLILGIVFVVLVTVFRHGVAGGILDFAKRRRRSTREVDIEADRDAMAQLSIVTPEPGAPAGAPVLEARGITKRYGGLTAVSGVDFALSEGEIRGVIGPNGAGKSTFFAMLAGELPTTEGQVYFRGREITGIGVTAVCQLGMSKSYQINQLFEALTVRQNTMIPVLARRRGKFRTDMLRGLHNTEGLDEQVNAAIELVGLTHQADTLVSELPYGEKRRLEIGLALATGANVLLFDEPLAGLGPEERVLVVALLKSIRKGRSMVIVEHDMDAMFELAERITVLYEGRKLAEGTPDEIRINPAVQAAYLGGMDDHEPA
ncbi:ABC transporter permease subunit [Parapusillimonas granuli]|uniref:Branched-chain amino acid ABC transporter ATP-binding protein/permease n=1 Tax=Parapusillimonas granuli TaxID=380911 RepID=A0A853G5Z3_9BURK|nr:branched-chain amino acid ABC transporter ATP-binding protein/permease [Parapusillimonas granuli]MBB5217136.1 branched-chain amino acid transport system permease protein [Parapusillimonas granuli]MEB2401601.1 branched-chain amino acid ABC transporter ATP-binding protein/permease [Alcaligenaceae bacterium]NYT50101.1 branched-chain amino acid ABC transporter ATP-binding protein/permease [Parapusillimonas granuli]